MPKSKDSLVRNIGRFTGEIWRAIESPTTEKHEIRRTVETDVQDTDAGKVTLRRITVEEIEVTKNNTLWP